MGYTDETIANDMNDLSVNDNQRAFNSNDEGNPEEGGWSKGKIALAAGGGVALAAAAAGGIYAYKKSHADDDENAQGNAESEPAQEEGRFLDWPF